MSSYRQLVLIFVNLLKRPAPVAIPVAGSITPPRTLISEIKSCLKLGGEPIPEVAAATGAGSGKLVEAMLHRFQVSWRVNITYRLVCEISYILVTIYRFNSS